MSFHEDQEPLTHTVAYTIQGLLELGISASRDDWIEAAAGAADKVRKLQDPATGAVPGRIAKGYRAAVSWTNTTANSQMAVIWFRLAQATGDRSWAEAGRKVNRFNQSLHELDGKDPGIRGALRGSYPGHVGYGSYCYMNWTQKFFLDALLAEARAVDER
jgi:uncharacterized protein YyaL (SSP411 family)